MQPDPTRFVFTPGLDEQDATSMRTQLGRLIRQTRPIHLLAVSVPRPGDSPGVRVCSGCAGSLMESEQTTLLMTELGFAKGHYTSVDYIAEHDVFDILHIGEDHRSQHWRCYPLKRSSYWVVPAFSGKRGNHSVVLQLCWHAHLNLNILAYFVRKYWFENEAPQRVIVMPVEDCGCSPADVPAPIGSIHFDERAQAEAIITDHVSGLFRCR